MAVIIHVVFTVLLSCCFLSWTEPVFAHCDTLDGPVVDQAAKALEKGDVNLVLPWVREKDEAEVIKVFNETSAVRKLGTDARGLADRYFFETLVRIHRAGEGAPYTGLQPAGMVDPAILEADKTLQDGVIEKLIEKVTDQAASGIRQRFKRVMEKKAHAQHSVSAGREYVAAYVDFIHYVERLHADSVGSGGHADAEARETSHQIERPGAENAQRHEHK